MNLLAVLLRRLIPMIAMAIGGLLALLLFALLACRPWAGAPVRPTPAPAVDPNVIVDLNVIVRSGAGAPSERQAATVAVAFGQAYFSGGDVLPYLTPTEARAWTQQPSGSTSAASTVADVTVTLEGAASDGSLGFIVDAFVNAREQAVEVFVIGQNDHCLIERVSP